jgi:hypothetical protein
MKLLVVLAAVAGSAAVVPGAAPGAPPPTVWLCRPGQAANPCTSSLATTVVQASGATSVVDARPATRSRFDCFYVYPTVSQEATANSDLRVQEAETAVAIAQASRFSTVCRVFAPMYRQITLSMLFAHPALDIPAAYVAKAYTSLASGFEDYLAHLNDGRPIVFIGHSQGTVMLIRLLARVVDANPRLRDRLVLAILLGGDVETRSFAHIPLCSHRAAHGCVIAYSSFPGEPPATAVFGRPGQGVALQSGQPARKGSRIACVNPAALGGGRAALDPYFPSLGRASTPWVAYPGLYTGRCRSAGGAVWLQVEKATGRSDKRPVVTDRAPDFGYHNDDVNLALGNLVADVAAAERSWAAAH